MSSKSDSGCSFKLLCCMDLMKLWSLKHLKKCFVGILYVVLSSSDFINLFPLKRSDTLTLPLVDQNLILAFAQLFWYSSFLKTDSEITVITCPNEPEHCVSVVFFKKGLYAFLMNFSLSAEYIYMFIGILFDWDSIVTHSRRWLLIKQKYACCNLHCQKLPMAIAVFFCHMVNIARRAKVLNICYSA